MAIMAALVLGVWVVVYLLSLSEPIDPWEYNALLCL